MEFVKFNNWLNVKYETVPSERIQGLKEHLYSIIDSHVKQLHARTGKTYPSEKDLILPGCFMWGTRMGIPGADQVLERLDPETAKLLKTSARLPDSFMLTLDGEHFVLSSSLGPWRATFPYYFMINELRDFDATNGMRTQIAIVSTGFGRHAGSDGYSQATIMLVYAPMGADANFTQFWLEKYGLTVADKLKEPVRGMPAYRRYDSKTKLHTEVVFPTSGDGAMAVSYMGLDGTYQWNRQHFEDFLAILHLSTKD